MNLYSYSFKGMCAAAGVKLLAAVMVLTLCSATLVPPVWSQETAPPPVAASEGGTASSAGMQAAAGFSTLLYLPFKAAFAIGGGIVGGLTYLFSGLDENSAKRVWNTTLYGTYIITPEHLQGDKPIRFLGVPDQADQATGQPAPEPIR